MSLKFIGFKPSLQHPFDYATNKRWRKEGNVYKLVNPDLQQDRQFTTAHIVDIYSKQNSVKKGYDPEDKLYIAGIANANIIDRMMERLDPTGLDIVDYMKNRQLLAHHSYYCPIGQVEELSVEDDGVHFVAWIGNPKIAMLTDMQREIRSLVAQGILRTVSVGFIPKKVKEPVWSDQGELVEPAVIQSWELLELSVVSVPCNQDSLFEMRDYPKQKRSATIVSNVPDKTKKISDIVSDLVSQNTQVQTLIFDAMEFSASEAVAWAKEHGFKADKIDETDDSYRLRQRDPEDFDSETFRTIDMTEGVQAVVGKLKNENTEDKPKVEDSKPEDCMQEVLSLARAMAEGQKKMYDYVEKIYSKIYEDKPKEDKPKPEEEEESKAIKTQIKAIEDKLAKFEDVLDLLVKSMKK